MIYRIHIPKDIATLLLTVVKKDKVTKGFLVTPISVQGCSHEGTVCYMHGARIDSVSSFVFPVENTFKVTADMEIEWEVGVDESGAEYVKSARFIVAGHAVDVIKPYCSDKTPQSLPEFRPFSKALASEIPAIQRNATNNKKNFRYFPGMTFTEKSAFATDGRLFACWTDSNFNLPENLPGRCETTAAILAAYTDCFKSVEPEIRTSYQLLYDDCLKNPNDNAEHFDFSDDHDYSTVEEWLKLFQEQFPTLDDFIQQFLDCREKSAKGVSITFPKYLDKILVEDECQYGFSAELAYTCYDFNVPVPTHVVVSFFLATETYLGTKLPGRLVWYSYLDTSRPAPEQTLDNMIFHKAAGYAKENYFTLQTATFTELQKRGKDCKEAAKAEHPNMSFVNCESKLGIGNLLNKKIQAVCTEHAALAGLKNQVTVPLAFADINVPATQTTVTMALREDDPYNPVFVFAGNVMHCFARIERFDNNKEREIYPVQYVHRPAPVITLPAAPPRGFGFIPTLINAKK